MFTPTAARPLTAPSTRVCLCVRHPDQEAVVAGGGRFDAEGGEGAQEGGERVSPPPLLYPLSRVPSSFLLYLPSQICPFVRPSLGIEFLLGDASTVKTLPLGT